MTLRSATSRMIPLLAAAAAISVTTAGYAVNCNLNLVPNTNACSSSNNNFSAYVGCSATSKGANACKSGTQYTGATINGTDTTGNQAYDKPVAVNCSAPVTCNELPNTGSICSGGSCTVNGANMNSQCFTCSQSVGAIQYQPSTQLKACPK